MRTASEQERAEQKQPASSISDAVLRQLNLHQHEAELARERYAHALTRELLVKHAAEAAAVKAELEAIKAREQVKGVVVETRNEAKAAVERLEKLTTTIRNDHNLTEQHAIDALTGAVISPEG